MIMVKKILIFVSATTYDHPNTFDWIPVQASQEHENCYKILESSSDPEHDYWQFTLNDVVICRAYKFAENEFGLIALEKCSHNLDTN